MISILNSAETGTLTERVVAAIGRSRNRRWLTDLVLAAAWLIVGALHLLVPGADLWEDSSFGFTYRSADVWAWLLIAALCIPVVWGRRYPTTAFAVSWSALVLLVVGDYLVGLMGFVVWILMYGVGAYATRRRTLAAMAMLFAGLVIARLSDYPGFDNATAIRNALILGAFLQVGRFAAASRRNARARVELADQRAIVSDQAAHTALVEERLRLAQELHDIVAHSMSVISVQASMGTAAFDQRPDQSRRALVNIERTSRNTLAELRGLLGVLRDDNGARATLTPSPTLRDLPSLVAALQQAGVAATVVQDGPMALPAGADAFGYRIVQEAVTNVLKHARATTVSIEVHDTGTVALLDLCDDIEVVGQAANGREAVAAARTEQPDVVLMDIRMPEMDGLEATRQLAADPRTASCKVLILTTFDVDEYVYEALRFGASGFLLKDTRREQLVDAVRVVARGEALLSPSVTRRLIAEFAQRPALDTAKIKLLERITERERDVLLAVARGDSNADIAAALFMGAGTVKTHVSHLLTKIAVRDRAQLVVFAYESGLVSPGFVGDEPFCG